MGAIEKQINRFCWKHPNFGIPHLINYILIGNIIVFVLDMVSNGAATGLFSLDFGAAVLNFQFWRLLTFIFVPNSSKPFWFVVSLFFYYFLGNTMEQEWGTAKFSLFYLVGIILTYFASIVTYFWTGGGVFMTLSAVHDTLFLAFATLFPEEWIRIYFLIPVKAKWLALFYVFIEVWDIISINRILLPFLLPILLPPLVASWLNYMMFFWSDLKEIVGRSFRRAKHQNSKQTINFKKATRAYQERDTAHPQKPGKSYQEKGYIHKCAVCGKTDTDFPDMVFRYCSKCNGYYCYCEEHINNHEHVQ